MNPALCSWLIFAVLVPALAWAWSTHLRVRSLERRVEVVQDLIASQVKINREQGKINVANSVVARIAIDQADGAVLWQDRDGNVRRACE